jgi:NADPH:quinone reductase-like Zn-dependent oxidoreductase
MKAAIIRSYGEPKVLELAEVERPRPIPSEVLVRVHAAGTNPVETLIRAGVLRAVFGTITPPAILGWDVSGVVEEAVPGVTRFEVGDEVFGMPFFPRPAGAYAEYVAAPSRQFARKPRSIDHAHAAALPLAGLTAWQALVDTAHLEAGQRVLVHGGGGGVGHLAIQIAKARGAYVATTVSASKIDYVRSLGADQVIDYRAVDFTTEVRDFDVVLELIGHGYAARSIEVLRPGGLLVTAVERSNLELAGRVRAAGRRFAGITVEPDGAGLERLAELVDGGRLRPHVSHVVPLSEAARAHELLEAGGVTGKIVLST